MKDLNITRRQILKGAAAAGVAGALGIPAAAVADEEGGRRVRWDIINVVGGCVAAGGQASALSNDGSRITISGTGTFPDVRNRCRHDVTGGGKWTVEAEDAGCFPGSGTFSVTELLSWRPDGGTPPLPCDLIGPHSTSGLATLRVAYVNGATGTRTHGTLTISCHFVGAPECIFEGITATMEYEDFWNREAPVAGVAGNRTNFHFINENED